MTHSGAEPDAPQLSSTGHDAVDPAIVGDALIAALDALVEDPTVDRSQFFSSAAAAARDAAFTSRYRLLGVI